MTTEQTAPTEQAPATITTDGVTVTAWPGTDRYAVTGRRVAGNVTASLGMDTDDTWQDGRLVRVPAPAVTVWFGSRSDPANPPIEINGAHYVGHYACTASGRYLGANTDRVNADGSWSDAKVTDNARAVLHAIASAVATLHVTPDRIAARKLADADAAIAKAERNLADAQRALADARFARFALDPASAATGSTA